MLVDMPRIVGSRYPVSYCIQPTAGAAKGCGIEQTLACQKMYIISICILLLFLSCSWSISMRWVYGVW